MNKITSIAISGQNNTGKTTLCSILSQELQWKHIMVGEEFRKLARNYKLDIEDFGSIPDEKLIMIDNIMKQQMYTEKFRIWDGRLSCFLARDRKDIFKIFVTAELDVRIQRASKRGIIDFIKAKQQILDREEEEKRVFFRLYKLQNPYNKKWIDLILDTTNNTPDELAEIVLNKIKNLIEKN